MHSASILSIILCLASVNATVYGYNHNSCDYGVLSDQNGKCCLPQQIVENGICCNPPSSLISPVSITRTLDPATLTPINSQTQTAFQSSATSTMPTNIPNMTNPFTQTTSATPTSNSTANGTSSAINLSASGSDSFGFGIFATVFGIVAVFVSL